MTLPQLLAKAKKLAASYELPFDYEVEVTANANDTQTEFYCKIYPNREQYSGPLVWAGDKAKTEAEALQEFEEILDERSSNLKHNKTMSNLSPKVKVVCTYESATETTELRHNALIELLKHFKQYQGYFDKTDSPKEAVITGNIRVNINHINQAVVVLTDVLNMPAGSMNDIDLYRLLQCYLLDPDKRQKINQVLNNHIGQNTNRA